MASTNGKPAGRSKAKGTAADITRYQMEIVRFLAEAGEPRTIEQIHEYLAEQHGLQRDYNTVRRWLKKMREDTTHPFHRYLRVREVTDDEVDRGLNSKALVAESVQPLAESVTGKPKAADLVAESSPGLLMTELSAEEAWLLMLAERILDRIIPQDFFENRLGGVFRAARQALLKDPAMKMLANRIIYVPRGQRLYESPEVAEGRVEAVQEVMRAIRERKMVSFLYRGEAKERQVHPVALVYREPKLYLLALKEGSSSPTEYLCARMAEVSALDDRPNCVPDDYPVGDLEIDLNMHRQFGLDPEPVRLVLHIDASGQGNLIDDLKKYRLDPDQVLVDLGVGQWELTIPKVMITAQLMQWIGGMWGHIAFVEPQAIREIVKARVPRVA